MNLSPRQIEVARGVSLGEPNKLIADHLGISIRTVETHRAKLMKKLNLRCAADITRWAFRNHIIKASDETNTSQS